MESDPGAFLIPKREKSAVLPKRIVQKCKLLENAAFFLYHGKRHICRMGESTMEEKEKAPDSTPEPIKKIWNSVLGSSEEPANDENRAD